MSQTSWFFAYNAIRNTIALKAKKEYSVFFIDEFLGRINIKKKATRRQLFKKYMLIMI